MTVARTIEPALLMENGEIALVSFNLTSDTEEHLAQFTDLIMGTFVKANKYTQLLHETNKVFTTRLLAGDLKTDHGEDYA